MIQVRSGEENIPSDMRDTDALERIRLLISESDLRTFFAEIVTVEIQIAQKRYLAVLHGSHRSILLSCRLYPYLKYSTIRCASVGPASIARLCL
jgi:hypothetical protein